MFKKVLLTIGLLLVAQVAAFAQGTLRGAITDEKTGEGIAFANVVAKQNDQIMGGARTDFDGNYQIKGLQVGRYVVEVSYVGYATVRTEINVKPSDYTVYNEQLSKAGQQLNKVVVKEHKNPIIDIGNAASTKHISGDDISKMPGSDISSVVASMAGIGYSDGGTGTARGADGMVTMEGSVRKRTGVNVPKEAIADIEVILGGTPASIGESIGGTQIITLRPPQNNFKGLVKYETYADYRLRNDLVVWLTGPLVKVPLKDSEGNVTGERPLVGFRFTGQGNYQKHPLYRAKDGLYRVVKDEKVREIEQAPIDYNPITGTTNYAAEYLRSSDFVTIRRPNARNYYASSDRVADFSTYSIIMQGALDFRFNDHTSLVITGEYGTSSSPSTQVANLPLNLHTAADGVSRTHDMMVKVDFTQRLKDQEPTQDENNPDAKSEPAVSKVMWNASFMWNRTTSKSYMEEFGDDVFKYGHIGKFVTEYTPTYELSSNFNYDGTVQTAYVQNSWRENIVSFTPSAYNPLLANFNTQLYNLGVFDMYQESGILNADIFRSRLGLLNGGSPGNVYSLFYNTGVRNDSYAKSEDNYLYGQFKVSASVMGHDLEIGYQYDQVSNSYYGLNAPGLWTIMRQSANAHITQLDFNSANPYFVGSNLYVDYDRLRGDGQTFFDENMRQALGLSTESTSWLDVDRYDPEFYAEHGGLSMLSASEMFNSGNFIVSYYGYDHTGEKYRSRTWSLDDFFDPKGRGHESYQYLLPFTPIYMAGYIQDKFYFSDLIFNVGVRVDRFDGNQMVLKDPYLLYESYTVGDLRNSSIAYNTGLDGNNFANNAQDNWVPYVDDASATTPTIRGYRSGGTWYDVNGVEISNPASIAGESGKPTPFRTQGVGGGQDISTNGNNSGYKISSNAFEDYDPQWVVMPRIAFSFPVNDAAQFKASYDIIARRPSSGWQADYLSYLNMTQISTVSNPNLKPERVTNYELGFQQVLNKAKTAAITLSAYYKETRDLIQLVQYAGADPNQNYYSYDNLDFMTTKGFSVSFDMRQSKNVTINANYTLQYAEGTGLSTTTMSELIKEGYTSLKMLNPIADDRRHEFKANLDYRMGSKEGWHKSRIVKDKDGNEKKKEFYPFQNAGINILAAAQSGRPYTRAFSITQNTIVGSYRGARLPWGFYVDVVADKTWFIRVKNAKGKARQTALSAAVTVTNLFDTRNILGVFSVTGNPTDNGYLTDPETQSIINSYLDPQSYRDMYSVYLNNSYWNYSRPRMIKLTLSYNF